MGRGTAVHPAGCAAVSTETRDQSSCSTVGVVRSAPQAWSRFPACSLANAAQLIPDGT